MCLDSNIDDVIEWRGNNNQLTAKDLYSKIDHNMQGTGIWIAFWKLKLPARIKIFIRKLLNQILTVRSFLKQRITCIDVSCPFCHQSEETIEHLFWHCHATYKIWDGIKEWWNINFHSISDQYSMVSLLTIREIKQIFRTPWMIVVGLVWWHTWKARNAVIFQSAQLDHTAVITIVKRESLLIGKNHGWLSNKVAGLWNIDPLTSLDNYSISERWNYLTNLLKEFALVGFSDGAWNASKGKGGIGGVLSAKASVTLFTCSGPATVTNTLGAEIEACKYLWHTMGEIEKTKHLALCVDSKNVVEMFQKAKIGATDGREGFEEIKKLCSIFPQVKLLYITRR